MYKRQLWLYLQELHKDGKTILLTTHYIDEAELLCERVGIIDKGKLIVEDTVSNLKKMVKNSSLEIRLKDNINKDIDNSWEILAEPIQMVARKHHIPDSYEYLKKYTRGEKVNQEVILKIINSLNIPESEKNNLAKLTPRKYIGYASKLCDE